MKSEAIAKIKAESAAYKGDRYGAAMKMYIAGRLEDFCQQNEEFAQAVVQGGKFEDCMKAVSGKVKGNVISDFDACAAAAQFYFPGCVVEFQMQIYMSKYEAEADAADTAAPADGILLRLEDYL